MIDKHVKLIAEAAKKKVQILCLQEIFYGPYFCAEQETRWYHLTERVPDGPTVTLMRKLAKKHRMVIVVPIYEEEQPGVYYNTAAVIDADGSYLGKYRKTHIPHCKPGFWEKFYFRPGNLGYPGVRDRLRARSASTSATTATSRRARGRSAWPGPRSSSIPRPPWPGSPSTCGSSSSRRTRSPTATSSAPSTGSASSRPGRSASSTARATSATRAARSWPQAPRDKDAVVVADLDLDMIEEVRAVWQFYRDRRPDAYGPLVAP